MNTLVKVVRYHLVSRAQYVLLPVGVTAFAFLVNLVIFAIVPTPQAGSFSGGLVTLYIFLFVSGVLSVTMSLPFGFTLGLSRRSYYLGTILLVLVLGAVYSLGITVLQAVEGAVGGWGLSLHFFRIPWFLDGAWYLTWLTSFVLLVLVFVYGMWFGLVYRRWDVTGLVVFIATQVVVLLAAALITTWVEAWPAIGDFFTTLTALGLTAVLAAIAAALALGGFTTMRRVTV
ncbi:MAG: ABC transporter permease [Pseudonocardiaceae bacterium]|nr:ABC transporter permease [Pseudonocardiaceae bacterium]